MSFPISITWSGGAPPVAGFQQMAKAASDLDSALSTSAGNMNQFGSTISQLESPLSSVGSSMGELSGNMQGLDSSLSSSAGAMGDFAGSTEQLNGAVSETGGFITEASGSMDQFGTSATEAGTGATELGTASTDAGTGVSELGTASTDTGGFITDLGTATGETNTVLGETGTVLSDTAPIMAETGTATGDLAQGFTDLAPPVETSNTALSDTVPILEGAGTAATEAGTSTDELSGALGGLGTELGPVTGGLTENNTVMGDLATTTGDTNTESGNLQGTLTTLGTGIGTVTGSALSLYSAFTNVRDAQAAVDKAQIKLIDANRKAETSYNTLNRAINKITADTENNISGQGRLAAAQAKLNALWDAGIRSGPQFAAALAELKGAQEGLTSSTTKGNEIIAKLGPNISAVESTSRKATNSTLGLTRANEGLVESFLGIAGGVIAGVSGLTQIATQAGNMGKAFGPIKGILTGVGGALSGTLVPALAAIAVPAAAAGAAVAAFIGVVTAIRARMGDVDAFGKKVGEVFPAMKGFLDTARQAFINLSDGVNTAISTVLGGFDSLTGGVLGAQKAWDSWTGKLAKGTGQMGLAGQAANIAAVNMSALSDRTNIGAGKWRELNGDLFKTNGTLKTTDDTLVATGHAWDVMGDGTAFYVKSAEKVPPTNEKINQTTTQMSEATKKAAAELAGLGTKLEEANAKVAFYSEGAKKAELMSVSFALGVAEAKVALIDEEAALATGAGALMEHGRQMADGTLQALAYKQGILEAGEALLEKVTALEQARGAYDATNALMADGTIQAVEYATGMQETKTAVQEATLEVSNLAGKLAAYNDAATAAAAISAEMAKGFLEGKQALVDLALETANAVGQIAALRTELADSESAALRFGAGLIEGRRSALEYLVGIEQAKGETAGFRAEVLSAAQEIPGAMQDMSNLSTKALQQFIEVVKGIPEAFEGILDDLEGFGKKMVAVLSKAGEDGKVNVMANIAQLEKDLNVKFSAPLKEKLKIEVAREEAMKQIDVLLGGLALSLANNPLKVEADTLPAQGAIQALVDYIDQAAAQGVTGLDPLRTALVNLANVDMTNIKEFAPALAQVVLQAKAAGQPFGDLLSKFQELGPLAQMSASELSAVGSAFQTMGLHLDTTTGKITDATGKLVGEWGKWGAGATAGVGEATTAMDTMGPAGDRARLSLAFQVRGLEELFRRMGVAAQLASTNTSGAFSNMATNTLNSMNRMASGLAIIIAAMPGLAKASQSAAATVSGSFSNMATNTTASMNRMASGLIIMIAAFPRLSQEAQKTNTAVTGAMNQMASRVSSTASAIQSNMSRIQSSMSSAERAARSLASAISALKSKTITITTVYVTRRITRFAAAGGAFITSSPTNVGPLNVSEFGQRELVTVTPLETPGRQPIKGLGDLAGRESEKKGRRAMAEEAEGPSAKKKEVVMMRELPIVITVDGREIARVVNKRIFEESDALV